MSGRFGVGMGSGKLVAIVPVGVLAACRSGDDMEVVVLDDEVDCVQSELETARERVERWAFRPGTLTHRTGERAASRSLHLRIENGFPKRMRPELSADSACASTLSRQVPMKTSGRKPKGESQTDRIRQEIRRINAHSQVPVPTAASPTAARTAWVPRRVASFLLVFLVGFVALAIRGDEPTTVVVAQGTVTPVPDMDPGVFADDNPHAVIDPTVGDLLDVCDWDYCIVHDHIGDARIEQFTYVIDLDEARAIARSVTGSLGLSPVTVEAEFLPGTVAGFYDPAIDLITLDEPIIAWTVIHELAHHVVIELHGPDVLSHGELFLVTLDGLVGH